jgi:outer membrane protein TolC
VRQPTRYRSPLAAALSALAISGCASFSDDGGMSTVSELTRDATGVEARWLRDAEAETAAQAEVERLLGGTLQADTALRIALLNNAELQAAYADLGLAEANRVAAGRLPNPGFTWSRTSEGGAFEIERGLHVDILALLTLPMRFEIESRRFDAAKLAAAEATVSTALRARRAWYDAVAARQSVDQFEQARESADTARELVRRMARVGNSSQLDLDRERLFHAETLNALARARQREIAAREALVRVLGLWGEQLAFELPRRLPELPVETKTYAELEREALATRLDLRRARHDLDAVASNLGLTEATRFVNVLEGGPAQVRERGEPIRDGYEITVEIPVFDFGSVGVARARALYGQAASRLRARAVSARSEVREAWLAYRTAYDVARNYRDEILPLRKRISDENLLRYNGMLISVFELIADAREQTATVNAYVGALREFWLADARLDGAMLTGSGGTGPSAAPSMPAGGDAGDH